jgi:hypothetical protein
MKAEEPGALQARVTKRPSVVRSDAPLEWAVRFTNRTQGTLHLATAIQQLQPSADGRQLLVSTERPIFDDSVSLAFFALDTTPVQPGESLETAFRVELPLRLTYFTGDPPRAEARPWTPAAQFTLLTRLAFGDRPFQRPTDPARLTAALHRWTHISEVAGMRLRVSRAGEE